LTVVGDAAFSTKEILHHIKAKLYFRSQSISKHPVEKLAQVTKEYKDWNVAFAPMLKIFIEF
jgi:hypothetical protein